MLRFAHHMDRTNHWPIDGEDGWSLEHYVYDEARQSARFKYEKHDLHGNVVDSMEFERNVDTRHDAPVRRAA